MNFHSSVVRWKSTKSHLSHHSSSIFLPLSIERIINFVSGLSNWWKLLIYDHKFGLKLKPPQWKICQPFYQLVELVPCVRLNANDIVKHANYKKGDGERKRARKRKKERETEMYGGARATRHPTGSQRQDSGSQSTPAYPLSSRVVETQRRISRMFEE